MDYPGSAAVIGETVASLRTGLASVSYAGRRASQHPGIVEEVRVNIGSLTHPNISHLSLALKAPDGTTVPLVDAGHGTAGRPGGPDGPRPGRAPVVDDDRNVQRMLADALGKAGFRVTVERDGEGCARGLRAAAVRRRAAGRPAPGAERLRGRGGGLKSTPRAARTPVLMLSGIYKTKMHQAQAGQCHGGRGIRREAFQAEPPVREARGGRLRPRPLVPQTAPRPFVKRVCRSPRPSPWPTRGHKAEASLVELDPRGVDGRRARARRARARAGQAPADRRTRAGPGDVRHPRLSPAAGGPAPAPGHRRSSAPRATR